MGKFSNEYNETLDNKGNPKNKSINYIKGKEILLSIVKILSSNSQRNISNITQIKNKIEVDDDIIINSNITQSKEQSSKEPNDNLNTYENDDISYLDKAQRDLNIFCSNPKSLSIKELITFLDKEINTVYFQFIYIERVLFTQLNSHLQLEQNYSSFNVLQLSSEMKKLNKLLLDTKDLCVYLNINMKCLDKILYHCDKKLSRFFNNQSIALKYLRTKFESQNSDLTYILQYKLIDEITAIGPYLLTQLDYYLLLCKSCNNTGSLNSSLTMTFESNNQNLLSQCEDFLTSFTQDKTTKNILFTKINAYQLNIKKLIEWLNVSNEYRIQFKNYSIGIRYGFRAILNTVYFSGVQLEDGNEGIEINCLMDEELLIRKFLNKSGLKEYLNYWSQIITKENRINIHLIYLHTLLYLFVFAFTYLSPLFSCLRIHQSISIMQTFFLSVIYVHIGEIISNFIFGFLLKKNMKYVSSIILSCLFLILGFIVILLYQYINTPPNHIYMLFISRLLIGLGSGKIINRKYLITYSPRPLLKKTIKKYHLVSEGGLIVGLILFSFIGLMIRKKLVSFYWVFDLSSLIIIFIYLISFIILFTNTKTANFSITSEDKVTLDSNQLSASHRKQISIIEYDLVQNANKQLDDNNQSQQYTTINNISNIIHDLIQNEKHCFFSYINKAYIGLSFILFFNTMLHSVVILYVILSLSVLRIKKEGYYLPLIALFLSIPIGHLIPILFKNINKQWCNIKRLSNRISILILLTFQLLVPLLIFLQEYLNKSKKDIISHRLMSIFSMSIILYTQSVNYLIEQNCNSLLIKIIPQSYNIGKLNVSLFLTITSSIGRIIILMIYALKTTKLLDSFLRLLIPSFFAAPLLIALLFFKSLKLTSIGRIVKKSLYY